MIGLTKHIIKRQVFDVTVTDKQIGTDVQDRISKIYDSTIIPILDGILCDMNLSDEIIRIDQLEIDLGSLSLENFTDDLRIRLKSKLEDELVKIVYQAKNNITQKGVEIRRIPDLLSTNEYPESPSQNIPIVKKNGYGDFNAFEEFIKTGLFPWWSTEKQKDVSHLFKTIIAKEWYEKEVNRILSLLRFRNVRHRLFNTFKDADLTIFFSRINSKKGNKIIALGSEIHRLFNEVDKKNSTRKFVRIEILDVLIRELLLSKFVPIEINDVELASSIVADYLLENFDAGYSIKFQTEVQALKEWKFSFGKKKDFETSLAKKLNSNSNSNSNSKSLGISDRKEKRNIDPSKNTNSILNAKELESLVVGNAGLIILWPYLQIFFKELGLLDDDNQFDAESNSWRAIHLLHYLSHGSETAEESELILNKLICSLPLEASVPLEFELSEEEKHECENLLKAVVNNWKALKSTSTEGLKQSFIIRDGVFSYDQSGWTLTIERRSYDLLLHKLSWPISVLKFPWNHNLIHVRW